jgi:hypothetical protein
VLDGWTVDVVGGTGPGFMLDGPPDAGLELGLGLPFPLPSYGLLPLGGLAAGVFDVVGFGETTDGGAGVLLEGLGPAFAGGGWVGKGVDVELPGPESSPEPGTVFCGGPAGELEAGIELELLGTESPPGAGIVFCEGPAGEL